MARTETIFQENAGRLHSLTRILRWQALKLLVGRVWSKIWDDQVMLMAAGVAFFGFLSLVPLIVSVLSIYGILSDPWTIQESLGPALELLPAEGYSVVQNQLIKLSEEEDGVLRWATLFTLVIALWSAGAGTTALMESINRAYKMKESRSFLKLRGLAILFTIGFFIFGAICFTLLAAIPAFFSYLGFPYSTDEIVNIGRWPVLALIMCLWIDLLYRFAPNRQRPKWQWFSNGAVVATALWLLGSGLLSMYVSSIVNMSATYGSLGGVMVFLLWLYLSAFSILLGAEVNAETPEVVRRLPS